MKLESSVSSFKLVKPGFALIATRDGGLYCLMEYDRDKIHVMKKLMQALQMVAGLPVQDTHIIDAHILCLYESLPEHHQARIASKLKMSQEQILAHIHTLSQNLSNLCSSV